MNETRIIAAQKQAIRAIMLNIRLSMPPEARRGADLRIAVMIRSSRFYRGAKRILIYASVKNEVDLSPLADMAYRDGKIVCYPRCEGNGIMHFYETFPSMLVAGRFGIPEPPSTAVRIIPNERDLCIAPGIAYDDSGQRLGYGGGYYDRFFAAWPVERMGVFYSAQRIDSLPYDDNDVRLNIIVSN